MATSVIEHEIVALYEDCDLDTQSIAVQLEMDELAVKAALAQYSTKYREAQFECERTNGHTEQPPNLFGVIPPNENPGAPLKRNETKSNFMTDDERRLIRQNMFNLALESEIDTVRARMSVFLYEEDKGRNEARVAKLGALKESGITVNQLNIQILKSRRAIEQLKQAAKTPATDVAKMEPINV